MEDKQLQRIADELVKINQKFEKIIEMMISARKKLSDSEEPAKPAIGSRGEFGDKNHSEK